MLFLEEFLDAGKQLLHLQRPVVRADDSRVTQHVKLRCVAGRIQDHEGRDLARVVGHLRKTMRIHFRKFTGCNQDLRSVDRNFIQSMKRRKTNTDTATVLHQQFDQSPHVPGMIIQNQYFFFHGSLRCSQYITGNDLL